MKTLELFSGTGSFSKVALELGHEIFRVEKNESFEAELYVDLTEEYALDMICNMAYEKRFDMIWASPPCQGFCIPAVRYHWRDGKPISETSRCGLKLLENTLKIIDHIQPKYWFIENPMAMMRKQPMMQGLKRDTVTYCQYGDTAMKPTDIWNNLTGWTGKRCKNGDPCHVRAPRGSKTPGSTQGKKNAKERGMIPPALFREIFQHIKKGEGSQDG